MKQLAFEFGYHKTKSLQKGSRGLDPGIVSGYTPIDMLPFLRSYFVSLFFEPDVLIEADPADTGLLWEDVSFSAGPGERLHGYFFKPAGPPLGTVVHCHGNKGNLTHHLSSALFLVKAGYNLLTFDYRGFGKSLGKPTPQSIVDDALSALRCVRARPDVNPDRIILFGQSLGGAAASGAAARDADVKAVVLEATFTTYRAMAKATFLGRFLFFLVPWVIPDTGPLRDLPRIAPRPVLIVHGDGDEKVPHRFSDELYKAALEPKSFGLLKSMGHMKGEEIGTLYDQIILRFLKAHVPEL